MINVINRSVLGLNNCIFGRVLPFPLYQCVSDCQSILFHFSVSGEYCITCKLPADDRNFVVELREKGSKGVDEESKAHSDDICIKPGDRVHR